MISVHGKTPGVVISSKVLEYTFASPEDEGVISIAQMFEEANYYRIDALVFFCWCYVRTKFFRDPCMKSWDYGKIGGNYETSRAGIKAALGELDKYEDTSMMNEQEAVEVLYAKILDYCKGIIYTPPKPPPEPPKPPVEDPAPPKEEPIPIPPKEEPIPIPGTTPPVDKSGSWWGRNYKVICGALISILIGACAILPIPSFASSLIKIALQALKSAFGL